MFKLGVKHWRFLYRGLKARWRDERHEIAALTSGLKSGDIALDVGTNKGSFLPSFSRAVPQGRVIAFEPQKVLADYVRERCAQAGFTNVEVIAAGLSDTSGEAELHVPGDEAHSPGASLENKFDSSEPVRNLRIPITTIDAEMAKRDGRVGAIKIDVEGHELAVLRGGAATIRRDRPVIVVECEQRHLVNGRVADLFELMCEYKYDGHFYYRGGTCKTSEFEPKLHQVEQGPAFWNAKGYVNNFIFIPNQAS
ncbi:FkbM family methyltransferase [Tepidamorphus sp. 3E244]|uniref:FkbM family methyltransferase n=1 Tax=Tepidamorphus sp. 3E244 TaxID=3385498 RepID=UPI0038FC141A